MTKSKITRFSFFYIILFMFVAYNFCYLVIIGQNKALISLLSSDNLVVISNEAKTFRAHNFFLIFILPIIGFLLSAISFISLFIMQATIVKKKIPSAKLFFLIINFIVIQFGLYITFIGQLFYIEWNNSQVIISIGSDGKKYKAIDFYKNWLSFTQQWIVFAVFFGITIVAIIFIIKIHFINIEYEHYFSDRKYDDSSNYDGKNPIPVNFEFNPDETQTVTISLDDTCGKTSKIKLKKHRKPK